MLIVRRRILKKVGKTLLIKKPIRIVISVLLLGWSFDILFWNNPVGLNYPIFIALCLIGGSSLLLGFRIRPAWSSTLLIFPILFFGLITNFRQEPLTLFLAYTISIGSLGLLAVTYQGGRWIQYGPIDYILHSLELFGSILARPAIFFFEVIREKSKEAKQPKSHSIKPFVRGLLIAVPIVLVFTSLLAAADPIFDQTIHSILDPFNFNRFGETILQVVIVVIIAYILAGAFLHAGQLSGSEKLIGEQNPIVRTFLGFIESAIVLGAVTLVFLLFVIIQFRYFFGGQTNISITGFTYSEYARRGFTELVVVAILSLVLSISLSLITRAGEKVQKRILLGLDVSIAAEVLVILISAFQRLSLAIDWHGYSRLRLYPRVFMIWLGALFVTIVILEILGHKRYFMLAIILASLGFTVHLSLSNVDASIVHYNVQRATQGKHFNVGLLTSLSADAVPELKKEFLNTTLPITVKEGVGAALACYQHTRGYTNYTPSDWRIFNATISNAASSLEQIKNELTAYHINDDGSLIRVQTPGNVWYECLDNPCADSSYCD